MLNTQRQLLKNVVAKVATLITKHYTFGARTNCKKIQLMSITISYQNVLVFKYCVEMRIKMAN